ncbi:MAG TPA: sulfite exporter TauE/SafE family protein [Noviherbaspirillum sp.]|nr:sulfite exporter TauE/SafE family protein [Noviherbaspirillum sp.]
MHYPMTSLALIAITFILAGMVKGMIGMGLPTVGMALLAPVMGPAESVALLVLPTLVTNVWQLVAGPRFLYLLRRFGTLVAGLFVGSFFGVRLLADPDLASILLGAVLAAYGVLGLSRARFSVPDRWERRLSPVTGIVTGVLYGSTGLAVTAVPYVNSLRLDKDALIQTLGLTFAVCSFGMALGLVAAGRFQTTVAGTSVLALLPAFAGMMIGQRLRERMNADTFRRYFFLSICALGIYMVWHTLAKG